MRPSELYCRPPWDPHRVEGGRVELPADDQPSFDLPVPEDADDPAVRAELVAADQAARELREMLPSERRVPLAELRRAIAQEDPRRTLATRDPRVRVEMVQREGGTTMTEAAVARGLRWLAIHQMPNGRWKLERFAQSHRCRDDCQHRGAIRSDSAATSLALLPFLGAGQTHQHGRYRDVVERGLTWLLAVQSDDGDLRYDSDLQASMYAHGQATIVLCEAYEMTGDAMLREPAQRAVDFLVGAQHRRGGWRYQPGQAGDMSVQGWQLMALQSARIAGLQVPLETLARSERFLDRVMASDGYRYRYQRRSGPSAVMTAEAMLCRMYLGSSPRNESIQAGVAWLVAQHLPSGAEPNFYYWYYATQSLHHVGGWEWELWNRRMREILVDLQITQGHAAGSWDPIGPHGPSGGRLYSTALATCCLEVYYRHAPIFRGVENDELPVWEEFVRR